MDVAVIGGTGAEGFGLALRLARAGHRAIIGSRDAGRGADSAAKAADLAGGTVEGTDNAGAAAMAGGDGVVAVTVPYAGQAEIYRSIKDAVVPGAVVWDATSPLATAVGGRPWQVLRPWHGSAAEQARAILGDDGRVVAGLHTIAAEELQDLGHGVESDVLL
ncbi:MAG TPA: NAD(P)-binding domain-containing protein, partial [Actinomycetota bacterium]|nr:NAD(P)-binding domain-containing protein [Actinomycetota bacterium]